MKLTKSLLFALLMLTLASMAFGQPGSICIYYISGPGTSPLGYPCVEPRTPFPDGYIISIYWDENMNGGNDPNDRQPPQDSVNFRTFAFNHDDVGEPAGYFAMDPCFGVNLMPENPVYYLRISKPDAPAVCWYSDTFRVVSGPSEWFMTPANWHCSDGAGCVSAGNPPAAPTNVTASQDQFCMMVRVGWHAADALADGFHVYAVGNPVPVATATSTDSTADIGVGFEGDHQYYVKAYNAAGESPASSNATGSTYLVRFRDDATANIRGSGWHGDPFDVHLRQASYDAPCNYSTELWLLHAGLNGVWQRFGIAPVAIDTIGDTLIEGTFPNNDTLITLRLLLIDSSFSFATVFTDTTDSIFNLADPNTIDPNESLLPNRFEISQNYPNPFNPTTEINFSVPIQSEIRIKVYNVMGQLVRTLVQGNYSAGFHRIQWDGKSDSGIGLSSGVYIYRMEGPGFVQAKKMLLMK